MDFSKRTKQDFIDFRAAEQAAFQLSPEEQAAQDKAALDQLILITKDKLSPYGITFTGKETDLSTLWDKYIKGTGTSKNPDMKEFLGDNLDDILATKVQNHNNLKDFANFVLQYES